MKDQLAQQILSEIKNIKTDIGSIKTEIGTLKTEIGTLKTEIGSVKTEIGTLKTEIGSVKTEIGTIKTEIGTIKTEIGSIKSEISVIKSQLDENTQIVKVIRDRQEETDAKLENLTMDVHHMRGDLTALTEGVAIIKNELDFTSHRTYKNEKEIFNIRKEMLAKN